MNDFSFSLPYNKMSKNVLFSLEFKLKCRTVTCENKAMTLLMISMDLV